MPHAVLRGGGSSCAWPAPFRPAAPATLPAVLHLNARMHQWPRRTDTSDDVRRYVILRIPRSDGRAHSCFRPDAGAQQHCGKPCTAHRDRSNHHGFKTDGFVTPPSPPARAGAAALSMLAMSVFASTASAEVNTTGLAVTDTEVTVGQLHSATGTMAISRPDRSRPSDWPSSRSTPPAAFLVGRSR